VAINTAIYMYSVIPGSAIYPAADLDGLSRYLLSPNGARRYRLGPYFWRDTSAAGQPSTSTLVSRDSRIVSRQVSYLHAAASNLLPILWAYFCCALLHYLVALFWEMV